MAKDLLQPEKGSRGRPATGQGTPVQVRLDRELLALLDRFIALEQPGATRPKAIRAILMARLRKRRP